MKLLLIISFLLTVATCNAAEYIFKVPRNSVRMINGNGFHSPEWYIKEYNLSNLINLSFFTGKSFIGPYKDSMTIDNTNRHKWSIMCIGDSCASLVVSGIIPSNVTYSVSGYPVLIKDGKPSTFRRTFFTKRICPRTVLAIHSDGDIVIYINTSANLVTVRLRLLQLGCTDAINLDGGSSTYLYNSYKVIHSSKQRRTFPNILTW